MEDLADEIRALPRETTVDRYIQISNRYTTGAQYINHLFRFLNRDWIKREMDEGKKDVYEIYELCLVQWDLVVYDEAIKTVGPSAWELLITGRGGAMLEHPKIKQIVDSFAISLPREGARLVYIATCPLGKIASNYDNPSIGTIQESCISTENSQNNEALSSATHHWGLMVAHEDMSHHTLFDIQKVPGVGKELIEPRRLEIWRNRPRWNLFRVGYTFLSDDHIMDLGT